MINNVVVLGSGSAGLLAAITLKRRLPGLNVHIVRSPDIGIIGVGEGTTAHFGGHLFDYLKLNPKQFFAEADPSFKLGLKFIWGKGSDFFYPFMPELKMHPPELSRPMSYYYEQDPANIGPASACMTRDKVFWKRKDGGPEIQTAHAYHLENKKLVGWLENVAHALGVKFTDGNVIKVDHEMENVTALHLENGEIITADLYVDASGFRSELISKVLNEPWLDYRDSLFCDRAVIGGWARTDEPLHPYTTCETMESGWCWQIEHRRWINRGYVYSSRFISDEDALKEFLSKNPKVSNEPRVVKFKSGRVKRNWVGNVYALGNASGFVEPLEATALYVICIQSRRLAECLNESLGEPPPCVVELANQANAAEWDNIRDFLAIHYRFNDRLDTPFWQACRQETDIKGAAPMVHFYQENGPSFLPHGFIVHESNFFGVEGYLYLLLGQRVPHQKKLPPNPKEESILKGIFSHIGRNSDQAYDVAQALDILNSPKWKWGTPQPVAPGR